MAMEIARRPSSEGMRAVPFSETFFTGAVSLLVRALPSDDKLRSVAWRLSSPASFQAGCPSRFRRPGCNRSLPFPLPFATLLLSLWGMLDMTGMPDPHSDSRGRDKPWDHRFERGD